MGNAEREREQFPRCWTIQSQAERRDRGQTEESWLLFEGIVTFLYDLTRGVRKSENWHLWGFRFFGGSGEGR